MTALSLPANADLDEAQHFLGVCASARGFFWQDRLEGQAINTATAISQRYDLPDLLGRVLAGRGVLLDDVPLALNPTLKDLMPDPSVLQDMTKGAERIADAIESNQKVAVFGDYDVDGATSSALLARLFTAHGLATRIYIPDRIFEGYGPNETAIESLVDEGADLIITVDCGTTSHKALSVAVKRNVDVVIVDHHQADEMLPEACAIINPNRQDDLSGQGHLAAAGVVFLLMVEVVRVLRKRSWYNQERAEPDLLEWLDLVALATVCDVVPLEGLNRAYVSKGLQVMRLRNNLGLRALADAAGLNTAPTPYHLGFVLGPRINAGGRIGDAGLGAKLLTLSDDFEAERIAKLLDQLNKERKEMEKQILEEALSQAEKDLDEEPDMPLLITGSQDWHKGLVGLVASRLTEKFRRPSLVISWDGKDHGTGSARSISGVDLGAVIRAAMAEGLLIKGGGHAMAAGLTVERKKFEELRSFLSDGLAKSVSYARASSGLKLDGALTPRSVTPELMELLDKAGPYGAGNPTPRFAFPAHTISFAKIVGEAHIRCSLVASDNSRIDAIAFRAVGSELGELLLRSSGKPLHVAGQLRRNDWGGREKIELTIDDVADPQKQGV